MQRPSPTDSVIHAATADSKPLPHPTRFVRRPLSGASSDGRKVHDGRKVIHRPATHTHAQQTSTSQRAEYNRRIGEMMRTDIQSTQSSYDDLLTLEQLRVFEEVWRTV